MKFDSDDFPILKLVEAQPGGIPDDVLDDFKKAGAGSDDDKFSAALTIYSLVNGDRHNEPPGTTPELYELTRKQCLDVFKDCASRNHVDSIYMVSYCYQYGHGCDVKPALAAAWRLKGDRLSKPAGPKGPAL